MKQFKGFYPCAFCGLKEAKPRDHQLLFGDGTVTVSLGGEIPLDNPDTEMCIDCQRKALEKALEALNEVAK